MVKLQRAPKRTYTEQYKQEAVSLANEVGPAEAAQRLDIPVKSLTNSLLLLRAGQAIASEKRAPVSELEADNYWLRSENARLKMEHEILRKAAATFAKESL